MDFGRFIPGYNQPSENDGERMVASSSRQRILAVFTSHPEDKEGQYGRIRLDGEILYTPIMIELLGPFPENDDLTILRKYFKSVGDSRRTIDVPLNLTRRDFYGVPQVAFGASNERQERAIRELGPVGPRSRYVLVDPFALQAWIKLSGRSQEGHSKKKT
jgi:hypothetical protein